MRLLYIIGEPGIGKTSLVNKLIGHVNCVEKSIPYVTWIEYKPHVAQLGRNREAFGGTDALGMAVQKHALALLGEWLKEGPYTHVLAEGDRLANMKFFDWCEDNEVDLEVMALWNTKLAKERRRQRNTQLKKKQDNRWISSRRTKVKNLMKLYVEDENVINPKNSKQIEKIKQHPVIQAILE